MLLKTHVLLILNAYILFSSILTGFSGLFLIKLYKTNMP